MKKIILISICSIMSALLAFAQYMIITSDQVLDQIQHGRVLLVDVRSSEEYRQAHIPGAINIPAERIMAERSRLPKERPAPVIFYCRGLG